MGSAQAGDVSATRAARRPRSRGVLAPARRSRHNARARARLIWTTMYPLPRILITVAVFVGLLYGLLALIFLTPRSVGVTVYYLGIPAVLVGGILLFSRGEPSDQTHVRMPRRMSNAEFDALEDRVERLAGPGASAADPPRNARHSGAFDPAHDEADFIELVGQAIDGLPAEFARALEHVGVVVSDQGSVQRLNGRRQPLYGLYVGYGARSSYVFGAPVGGVQPDRIVVFRDTLVHDYGSDPDRLRAEVTRTLRHELAHHLGWDESGVRGLGL